MCYPSQFVVPNGPHFRPRKLNTRPGPGCGVQVVSQGHYVTLQMAEVAVPRDLFRKILRLIDDLRPSFTPA